jgi:hypothetical protein
LVTKWAKWSWSAPSWANLAHTRWVVSTAIRAIKDQSLTSLSDGPIDILIMPYYRAQLQTYQELLLEERDKGTITDDEYRRIRTATLDSSQGDEADFAFVDLTRTDDMGFCKSSIFPCTAGLHLKLLLHVS